MFPLILNNRFFAKHPIVKRVVKAFLGYIGFTVAISVIVSLSEGANVIWALVDAIIARSCFWRACSSHILLFPFPTVVIITGIIFIIIDLVADESIIARHKKRSIFIIVGAVIILTGWLVADPFIKQWFERRSIAKDAEYYMREYLETNTPISPQKFIYSKYNRITAGNLDESEERPIKEIQLDEQSKIFSVSPGGLYYIAMHKSGENEEILEVRSVTGNTIMTSMARPVFHKDEIKQCKWSIRDEFFACQYFDKESDRRQLLLFDIAHGSMVSVYDQPNTEHRDNLRENFTWSDTTLDLFYDQEQKIYHIDNIKEMSESGFAISPHRVLLDYLAPCFGAGAYQNGTIYCITTADALPGYRTVPKNYFLEFGDEKGEMADSLIIGQQTEYGNGLASPIVVNKAPLPLGVFDVISFYSIDTTYIAAHHIDYIGANGTDYLTPSPYNLGFFLLNLHTGKMNNFQTLIINED